MKRVFKVIGITLLSAIGVLLIGHGKMDIINSSNKEN
jgi:hypothetical protein